MFGRLKRSAKHKRILSKNERIILVETEHEDGFVEKNLTTLDRMEKEWGPEYEYYVRNQNPGQESTLTEQVKKHGVAIFDTKYRTITVYQITNADEVAKMVRGDYDDPDFVCRTDGVEAEFMWRPDYAPEEARSKMRKLGIPEEFYIDRGR